MSLSVISYVALAVILGSLALAWSRRFLAIGALTIANVFVFGLTLVGGQRVCFVGDAPGVALTIHCELGLHGQALSSFEPLAFLQILTSMFVHADLMHLGGNLIVLLAFGLPFEERIGHRPFLLLYLLSGFAAALFQIAPSWGEPMLLMGASGAAFGIIGAFAGAYPRLVIPVPLPLLVIMIFVRMRVWVAAAVFGVTQVVLQTLSAYSPGSRVAYLAHLGGLAAGLVLSQVYVKRRMAAARAPEKIPVDRLRPFARASGAEKALQHMEQNRDQADVFMAWQERFFRSATCPACGAGVQPAKGGTLACRGGHVFDLRKGTSEHAASLGGDPAGVGGVGGPVHGEDERQ